MCEIFHVRNLFACKNQDSLLNYIEKNKDDEITEIEQKIQSYLDELIIKNEKITCIYLNNKGTRTLYKLVNGEWIIGEDTDRNKIIKEFTSLQVL